MNLHKITIAPKGAWLYLVFNRFQPRFKILFECLPFVNKRQSLIDISQCLSKFTLYFLACFALVGSCARSNV